eukprot:248053-Chlamydomonas_euryale.AAC.1
MHRLKADVYSSPPPPLLPLCFPHEPRSSWKPVHPFFPHTTSPRASPSGQASEARLAFSPAQQARILPLQRLVLRPQTARGTCVCVGGVGYGVRCGGVGGAVWGCGRCGVACGAERLGRCGMATWRVVRCGYVWTAGMGCGADSEGSGVVRDGKRSQTVLRQRFSFAPLCGWVGAGRRQDRVGGGSGRGRRRWTNKFGAPHLCSANSMRSARPAAAAAARLARSAAAARTASLRSKAFRRAASASACTVCAQVWGVGLRTAPRKTITTERRRHSLLGNILWEIKAWTYGLQERGCWEWARKCEM